MVLSCSKKLSELLRGITSKNNSNFNCSNCFHSFRTKINLIHKKWIWKKKDFCGVVAPSEDTKILDFN